MSERRCDKCEFYAPDFGECRRDPPKIVEHDPVDNRGYWPEVAPDSWCGEFSLNVEGDEP